MAHTERLLRKQKCLLLLIPLCQRLWTKVPIFRHWIDASWHWHARHRVGRSEIWQVARHRTLVIVPCVCHCRGCRCWRLRWNLPRLDERSVGRSAGAIRRRAVGVVRKHICIVTSPGYGRGIPTRGRVNRGLTEWIGPSNGVLPKFFDLDLH